MQPIKLIIEIRGGKLSAVFATTYLSYIVVDYDKIEYGASPVSGRLAPDFISDKLYTLYTDPDPASREIRDELKSRKF
ncbi:MAG: hypothetical protein H3C48_19030 [Chitinophagaceae bacterium]|nr:hypothetical protein [Chitinophagaceae bacterium]